MRHTTNHARSKRRGASPGATGRAGRPPTRAEQNAAFLAGLPMYGFDLIMADCPTEHEVWSKKGEAKSPQAHYPVMSTAELAALPIGNLAARDSVLFFWWTWPLLLGGDHKGRKPGNAHLSPAGVILDAWGFRYVTGGAWAKRTVNGKTAYGTGKRVRTACEPFLIAVRGSPLTSRAERNLIETVEADNLVNGVRREHSAKPPDAYEWCERYLPGARRLDLFSRRSRPGWTAAGDEVGKLDPKPGAAG